MKIDTNPNAPISASYIVKTADGILTNEQALGALATGIVKNTTTTGVLSIAATGTDYVAPGGALGTPSSGTLTSCTGLPLTGLVSDTTTALGIGSINLGHATDTTIARSGAGDITIEGNAVYRAGGTDVPVADGGTGLSATTVYAVLCGGTTTTGALQSIASVGTAGQVLTSNGAGALPTFQAAAGGGADTALSNLVENPVVMVATVNLSAANIQGMFVTPIECIAAPGSGKVIIVNEIVGSFTYGGIQFTGGGPVDLYYNGDSTRMSNAISDNGFFSAAEVNAAASKIRYKWMNDLVGLANTSVVIKNTTGAFATGNGTMKVFIRYRIITL